MKREILLTNDDSYKAQGINIIAQILRKFGNVLMIAPSTPQSAKSMALTMDAPIYLTKYDEFEWAFAKAKSGPLAIKETCCPSAPAYWQSCGGETAAGPRPCGCLDGRGFAFLSHVGDLQTCGFIVKPCGN